jgi:hypothetical protein
MEKKTPDFPAARRGRARRAAMAAVVSAIPIAASVAYGAGGPVTVKGKTVGAGKLLNPVWNEVKDNLHRFTFREPSASVRTDVRTLSAYLPKELCIAALVPGDAKPLGVPYRVVVAGGRTSRVTLVVAPGQQIQFENGDPFAHKLYVVGPDAKGLQPAETAPNKSRTWTPPGPGKYEIRDQMAPSLRSWVVVEPHVASIGYPDRKGDFQIDLEPGSYTLRGYFNGEPVGTELPVTVAPVPVEQPLKAPLVVGESDAPPPPAPAPGKPGGPPKKVGGG